VTKASLKLAVGIDYYNKEVLLAQG